MNRSVLAALTVLLAVGATTAWWLSSNSPPTGEEKSDKSDRAASTQSDWTTPDDENEPIRVSAGVPVASNDTIKRIEVKVSSHPQAGRFIRTQGHPKGSDDAQHWESLVHFAAFVALDGDVAAPAGIRIEVDAQSAKPTIEQLAPLVVAIRLGVTGRVFPADKLVAGLVTPSGRIIPLRSEDKLTALATNAATTYSIAPSINALLTQWGHKAPKPKQKPKPLPSRQERSEQSTLSTDIRQAVGIVLSGKPVSQPLPTDWPKLTGKLESWLRSAPIATATELVSHAALSARVRAAIRHVEFAEKRLEPFTSRVAKRPTRRFTDWEFPWLILLLKARIEGENHLREAASNIPVSPKRQNAQLPVAWLEQRTQELHDASKHLKTLITYVLPRQKTQPKPYPWSDIRHLAWIPGKLGNTQSVVADYGVQMARLGRLWAQLIITRTLNPLRNLEVAEDSALTVDNTELLYQLVSSTQERLRQTLQNSPHTPPATASAIAQEVAPSEKQPVHAAIKALERYWYAQTLANELGQPKLQLSPIR